VARRHGMPQRSPFRYFKTSPEIIRLALVIHVRVPLSLRTVENLLQERGIDISHESVPFWWTRFGPVFAAEIRKRRVEGMRSSGWPWHLDEVFVTKTVSGDTPIPGNANSAEIHLCSRIGLQPFQPLAPPMQQAEIQAQPRSCARRVA
jgi:hypothetical protein